MPVAMTSLALVASANPFSLGTSRSKELSGRQNTSKTLEAEASTYTVRYWIGSIVAGSTEPLLECTLLIDSCELEGFFVIGARPTFRASSSTARQRTPRFCLSPSEKSISKSRDQEKRRTAFQRGSG